MTRHTRLPGWVLLPAFLVLTGCGGFSLLPENPAERTFTLEWQGSSPYPGDGPVIYLEEPVMQGGLGGRVITVEMAGFERSALGGVRWAANLSDLIRGYMVRALRTNSGAQTIGEGSLDVDAACRMTLTVWAFQFSPGAEVAQDRVKMAIETSLVRLRDNALIGRATFDSAQPTPGDGEGAIMAAFNAGMDEVATNLGQWLLERRAACDEA
ncbi:ABC-type transport auxiliary lipoprotein family protein [Yunchengibacter salinarum]|uniref:ABC-type transport auxiliary lipoprotein family protein n=1 Tax=Yunchengibacter salinarum TaxID=3133399 RepID=UPI0035B69325